jgi:hypothetical protein
MLTPANIGDKVVDGMRAHGTTQMKSDCKMMIGSALIFLLFAFSQIYPFVHLYDSHGLTEESHQSDHTAFHCESERIRHHDKSDHHHHSFEQYADRRAPARVQLRGNVYRGDVAILPGWSSALVPVDCTLSADFGGLPHLRQSLLPSPMALRGPPHVV